MSVCFHRYQLMMSGGYRCALCDRYTHRPMRVRFLRLLSLPFSWALDRKIAE